MLWGASPILAMALYEGAQQFAELAADSLSGALEAAGLRLESRKAPQDVIVIDHAGKTPTEN